MGFKGDPVRLLVIPGLNDSGPAHWQSWLQAHFGRHAVRVEQDDWASADLTRWSQRIEMTLARYPGSRWVAAAHSFGIPHPPGTPVFVIALKAWAELLGFLSFARATNLFSAVCTASAVSVSTTRKAFRLDWLSSMASSERRTSSLDVTSPLASW